MQKPGDDTVLHTQILLSVSYRPYISSAQPQVRSGDASGLAFEG